MGNDGGSIPKRRELVKSAARAPTLAELKATALESLSHAWQHCLLSGDRLDLDNAVSDWRGRLYNYESVLKGLMPAGDEGGGKNEDGDRNGDGELPDGGGEGNGRAVAFASTGIKSLRDVVRLKFKRYSPADAKRDKEIWACPVSLKELGPSTKSVYLVPCGHVLAEVAIRQIPERTCPECSDEFKEEDVIPILSADEVELKRLSHRIEGLRAAGLTHSLKKDKSGGKRKRRAEDGKDSGETTKDSAAAPKKSKSDVSSRVGGINNAMTASLMAKVMAEQEERSKQRKLATAAGA